MFLAHWTGNDVEDRFKFEQGFKILLTHIKSTPIMLR